MQPIVFANFHDLQTPYYSSEEVHESCNLPPEHITNNRSKHQYENLSLETVFPRYEEPSSEYRTLMSILSTVGNGEDETETCFARDGGMTDEGDVDSVDVEGEKRRADAGSSMS